MRCSHPRKRSPEFASAACDSAAAATGSRAEGLACGANTHAAGPRPVPPGWLCSWITCRPCRAGLRRCRQRCKAWHPKPSSGPLPCSASMASRSAASSACCRQQIHLCPWQAMQRQRLLLPLLCLHAAQPSLAACWPQRRQCQRAMTAACRLGVPMPMLFWPEYAPSSRSKPKATAAMTAATSRQQLMWRQRSSG